MSRDLAGSGHLIQGRWRNLVSVVHIGAVSKQRLHRLDPIERRRRRQRKLPLLTIGNKPRSTHDHSVHRACTISSTRRGPEPRCRTRDGACGRCCMRHRLGGDCQRPQPTLVAWFTLTPALASRSTVLPRSQAAAAYTAVAPRCSPGPQLRSAHRLSLHA
eukprot:2173291-Rhodomonas_salina.2